MVDWSEIEALQAELAAACNEDVAQRLSGDRYSLYDRIYHIGGLL